MKDDRSAESPFRRMQFFLREIGQGPKGARDLSREEAKEAMELILADAVPSSQAGASSCWSDSKASRRTSCLDSPTPSGRVLISSNPASKDCSMWVARTMGAREAW